MNFINISTIPYSERKNTYVKLSSDFGYDKNGIYGRGKIGSVMVINNGKGEYYHTDYYQQAKEYAINIANELGFDFIYTYYN